MSKARVCRGCRESVSPADAVMDEPYIYHRECLAEILQERRKKTEEDARARAHEDRILEYRALAAEGKPIFKV